MVVALPTGRIALAGSGNTAVGRAAYPRIHLQDGLYLNRMFLVIHHPNH